MGCVMWGAGCDMRGAGGMMLVVACAVWGEECEVRWSGSGASMVLVLGSGRSNS